MTKPPVDMSPEAVARRAKRKQDYQKNGDAIRLRNQAYKDANRKEVQAQNAAYMRMRRASNDDPQFKLREAQRRMAYRVFNPMCKWNHDLVRFAAHFGAPITQVRQHLATFFKPGEGWHMVGKSLVVDHIKPLVAFDLSDPAQCDEAWNYKNLQILTRTENAIKSNTIDRQYMED